MKEKIKKSALYNKEIDMEVFFNWLNNEFLKDEEEVDPNNIRVSEQLTTELIKSVTAKKKDVAPWLFMWLNKGPKTDTSVSGMEVRLIHDKDEGAEETPFLSVGEEVGYHGRSGFIREIENGMAIVYFEDINEEEAIDIDELIEQNV